MAMKTLGDLYIHFLRDVLYAEKQALRAVRTMQRKAEAADLKAFFAEEREQADVEFDNLQKIFDDLDRSARGVRCEAMDGIVEESKEIMEDAQDGPTRDAAMIAAAQAMKHYMITRYGTLAAWANQLGYTDAAKLYKANLERNVAADEKLSAIAELHLNREADKLAA
jgi:ferritin-like metal-binding protein YciE